MAKPKAMADDDDDDDDDDDEEEEEEPLPKAKGKAKAAPEDDEDDDDDEEEEEEEAEVPMKKKKVDLDGGGTCHHLSSLSPPFSMSQFQTVVSSCCFVSLFLRSLRISMCIWQPGQATKVMVRGQLPSLPMFHTFVSASLS